MLSYQHAYHAGSRADIHKHDLLCRVLESLCVGEPIMCIEAHAGRGLYDLQSTEAVKTGEAGEGWLALKDNPDFLKQLAPSYLACVKSLNKGGLAPIYPGSPFLAAHILRKEDRLHLMELHPAEYAALKTNIDKTKYASLQKRDGLDGTLEVASRGAARGLVLIDPSYEVKTEYDTIPDFVVKLHRRWPGATILIWAPMLPALRHEAMAAKLKQSIQSVQISEVKWARQGEVRGMFGSIMMGINAGPAFQSGPASFINKP